MPILTQSRPSLSGNFIQLPDYNKASFIYRTRKLSTIAGFLPPPDTRLPNRVPKSRYDLQKLRFSVPPFFKDKRVVLIFLKIPGEDCSTMETMWEVSRGCRSRRSCDFRRGYYMVEYRGPFRHEIHTGKRFPDCGRGFAGKNPIPARSFDA